VYGGASPAHDSARYAELAERARLDLELLIGRRIAMRDVPAAFAQPSPVAGRTVMVNAL